MTFPRGGEERGWRAAFIWGREIRGRLNIVNFREDGHDANGRGRGLCLFIACKILLGALPGMWNVSMGAHLVPDLHSSPYEMKSF